MQPNAFGVFMLQAIIEPFVIGEVEALLLQRPFEIPIDFRHEAEAGMKLPDLPDGIGPAGAGGTWKIPKPE